MTPAIGRPMVKNISHGKINAISKRIFLSPSSLVSYLVLWLPSRAGQLHAVLLLFLADVFGDVPDIGKGLQEFRFPRPILEQLAALAMVR